MKKTRREFLKKMAYSAPVIVSLGMLVEPTTAAATNGTQNGEKNDKSGMQTK